MILDFSNNKYIFFKNLDFTENIHKIMDFFYNVLALLVVLALTWLGFL